MRAVFPLIATVAAAAFALAVLRQYADRRKPYQLAWGISLSMFAIASAALAAGVAGHWTPVEYQVYYLFGALLNVLWLALGTVYLLAPRPLARASLVALLAFSAAAVAVVLRTRFTAAEMASAVVPEPRHFLPFVPLRLLAAVDGGLGSLIVIGGAVWSGLALRGKRHLRSRFEGNLLIALGVLAAASGGVLVFLGSSDRLAAALALGATIMYLGFRRASAPLGAPALPAARASRRGVASS